MGRAFSLLPLWWGGRAAIWWAEQGQEPDSPACLWPLNAHTLCDLLFNFTSPLAFMRVIYKALGFDPQHKKQTPVSENVTRD